VNLFFQFRTLCVYPLLAAFLLSSVGCSYRPAYLQEAKKTEVSERWKVQKIDPNRLSADENAALEQFGTPEYVRFYRRLSQKREQVYAWIYPDPVRFVTFIDGKKIDYVVLDDDLTSLNERERNLRFWSLVIAGSVATVGLLYYAVVAKKK